ncbi:hypothetical protein ACU4GD_30620, partial [Cupriavidus basilensis]
WVGHLLVLLLVHLYSRMQHHNRTGVSRLRVRRNQQVCHLRRERFPNSTAIALQPCLSGSRSSIQMGA